MKIISRPLGLFAKRTFFVLREIETKGGIEMKWQRSLPAGTKDKLFREANGAYQLEKKVNDVIKKRGYQRIETPLIEYEDVFKNKEKNESDFYRFFDKNSRLLVLRPDMTTPIGRVLATTGIQPPLKLAYSGKVFRANDDLLGEQNEWTQAGIELIGYSSLKAEVECITCAVQVLTSVPINNFHFELGHSEIFRSIVAALNLTESEQSQLQIHVNNKSLSDLATFTQAHPSHLDRFIQKIPLLFGEATAVLEQAKELVASNQQLGKVMLELEKLVQTIKQNLPNLSLTIDLGLVARMDYYTGILFNGYADLVPDIFLRGGRYDQLTEQFGHSAVPAVGFGINLDTLVQLQYQTDTLAPLEQKDTLVYADLTCLHQAEKLINQSASYQLALFDTIEETIAYAKKWNYTQIICLSEAGTERIEVLSSHD